MGNFSLYSLLAAIYKGERVKCGKNEIFCGFNEKISYPCPPSIAIQSNTE